jgi:cytochrome c-type biogenesis protein CcmH
VHGASVQSTVLWAVLIGWLPAFAPRVMAEAPAGTAVPAREGTLVMELEEALVCQCGCGLTVRACNHLNCPSGIPIKEEIVARLGRGETKAQILAYFQGKYGEKVLSAPTLQGFNLVAWVAPGVFIVVGGLLVALVTRRWARETGALAAPAPPAPGGPDDEYRERLRREIDEFDA